LLDIGFVEQPVPDAAGWVAAADRCGEQAGELQIEFFTPALERLGPFGARPRLAVAASGGGDSSALALLARDYCAARGGEVRAYVVDHGLRAGSDAEAGLTARRLGARGIAARVLPLRGLPRGAGVQAAARDARYAALAEAAAEDGFLHLLLGHHAADQAETVAMRAARGPGGAEGIASWSARGRIILLRPLLGVRPELLRDYLRGQGMEWVEDPSNESVKFERVRARLAGVSAGPVGAVERRLREQEAAGFLAEHVQFYPEGFALLDAACAPPAALGALIRTMGGAAYPPRQEALARLGAELRAGTLGGVRLLPAGRLGTGWLLVREPAACAPPVAALAGALWDGRFRLEGAAPDMTLGALGAEAKKFKRFRGLPSIVLRGMPALRGADGVVSFPVNARFTPAAPATSHPFVV
jgi:tRNA(Ile)-lysidine synthase